MDCKIAIGAPTLFSTAMLYKSVSNQHTTIHVNSLSVAGKAVVLEIYGRCQTVSIDHSRPRTSITVYQERASQTTISNVHMPPKKVEKQNRPIRSPHRQPRRFQSLSKQIIVSPAPASWYAVLSNSTKNTSTVTEHD